MDSNTLNDAVARQLGAMHLEIINLQLQLTDLRQQLAAIKELKQEDQSAKK